MSEPITGPASGEAQGSRQKSRWLVFSIGERKVAVGIDYMVKILEHSELFRVPLSGREFKGVIYHNDLAVPILDWEFLTGRKISCENILIIEQNDDLLGMEIGELAKVEEHPWNDLNGDEGFWIDMEPENGLYALNVAKLFQALRKGG